MKRALGWMLYSFGWLWLIGSAGLAVGNPFVDSATRRDYVLGGVCGGGTFIASGLYLLLAVRRAQREAAIKAATTTKAVEKEGGRGERSV
jgi:hypothetical protein